MEINDELWNYLKKVNLDNENNTGVEEIDEKEDNKNVEICNNCNKDSLYIETGLHICTNCGSIIDRVIDSSAEWRYYGSEDSKSSDPTRCGLPINTLLPESSLGSVIGIKGFQSVEMQKIRKYHTWNSMPYKERSLFNVF